MARIPNLRYKSIKIKDGMVPFDKLGEERRKKILEEREAAKKAKEAETQKTNTTNN